MVVEAATWHGTRKRQRTKQSEGTPTVVDMMTCAAKKLRESLECEGSNENRITSALEDATKQLHDYYGEHLNADRTARLTETGRLCRRPRIEFIPGLVDQILLETSNGERSNSRRTADITRLLVPLILDFIEPCWGGNDTEKDVNVTGMRYNERSLQWGMTRIRDTLRPSKDSNIPELDALLGATGSHYGMVHERTIQEVLMTSFGYMSNQLDKYELNEQNGFDLSTKRTATELKVHLDTLILSIKASSCCDVNQTEIQRAIPDPNYVHEIEDIKPGNETMELWSKSPHDWILELHSTEDKLIDREEVSVHNQSITNHSFLGHMQDFLERHNKK